MYFFKVDNRSKRRREKGKLLQDFSSFAIQYREQAAHKVSPQLALATFQYLSSCMEPFKPEHISENVLRRLMQQGLVIRFIRVKNKEESKLDPAALLYQQVEIFVESIAIDTPNIHLCRENRPIILF